MSLRQLRDAARAIADLADAGWRFESPNHGCCSAGNNTAEKISAFQDRIEFLLSDGGDIAKAAYDEGRDREDIEDELRSLKRD
jgi:hypothetical protein